MVHRCEEEEAQHDGCEVGQAAQTLFLQLPMYIIHNVSVEGSEVESHRYFSLQAQRNEEAGVFVFKTRIYTVKCPRIYCVNQAGLELTATLLPQAPKY